MLMKAAVSTAIGRIEMQEIERPVPTVGEALIKVHYCGICGSDLKTFQHGDPYAAFPHVFGHEASGEIAELSSQTDQFAIGDRVVYDINVTCGKCRACVEGKECYCANMKIIGGHLPGAFAQYVKVPYKNIYKVPSDMPYELAALCEPYTVASRACMRAEITRGENVLILGAGGIALCAVALAKEQGCNVFIATRKDSRLERAKNFGPDALINTKKEDLYRRVMQLTSNAGCDVVIDATGDKCVIEDAERYVTRGGRLVVLGLCMDDISFNAFHIVTKELKIIGTQNSYGQYPSIIKALYEGRLHGDKYVTDIFPFERAQEAVEYAIANAGKCGKILLQFA
ncbi:MAG: alcohol dehydrogenase catalytic domain-containing protein [Clostridiales bacterium]|nr:alcohol dehydrogenase catalytic domain-containing protein [Clostridiales bacterium]